MRATRGSPEPDAWVVQQDLNRGPPMQSESKSVAPEFVTRAASMLEADGET